MGLDSTGGASTRSFPLPEEPRFVLKQFNKASMSLSEVSGTPTHTVETDIPSADALLVQLRLIGCKRIDYFSEGCHLERVDRNAGIIQVHDLRRNPVAVISDPFHVLHVSLPISALNLIAEEMHAAYVDELTVDAGRGVRDPVLRALLLAIRPALNRPEHANALVASHVAMAIGTHVALTYGGVRDRSKMPRGGLARWQERKAREMLDASIDADISLSELALACGLSTRHFARAFRQSLGMPPHRYLLQARVDRAKDLLVRTRRPLTEVALACGFADQSHFTRVFRAVMGVTPGVWRRLCRGESS